MNQFLSRMFVKSNRLSSLIINYPRQLQFHHSSLQKNSEKISPSPKQKLETVNITFIKNDKKISTNAKVGDNLLDVVIDNDIDLDGFGACEGTLSCSTCHLIFDKSQYESIGSKPSDEELDMLDLAYDLQETSRLGCQVIVRKDMDGWSVKVPSGISDARDV